ncbi:MAG: archease [bacterium]|nr:archease [bacterium]MDD5755970.1 archease [bacterium]
MIKKFEPFDAYKEFGTIGLKVNADEQQQIFDYAAQGMLKMMFDVAEIRESEKIKISVQGASKEELLVNFLNEILQQINAQEKAIASVQILSFDPLHLKAVLSGENFNRHKHPKKGNIKRVSFQNVEIKKTAVEVNGPLVWHAELIFIT